MKELIFSQGDFSLVKESGIGINNTPWERLRIISDGNANKHVVEVRLNFENDGKFDGEPVHYKYSSVSVIHGVRMATDTLAETQEYINCLIEALEFAKRVENFINSNEEWRE